MNPLMESVRVALQGKWEGESVKAECPVCSHERLYVLPPSGDDRPTFECGRGCPWTSLRQALLGRGVPEQAVRGRDESPVEATELPAPTDLLLHAPALLARHPEHLAYLQRLRLTPEQIEGQRLGLVRYGAGLWLSVPVFDADWVLRNVRYWNPFTGARFWPYAGNGGKWTLGVQFLEDVSAEALVLYCEGESDYLAAVGAGVPAVAVLAGAGAVPDDLSWAAGRKVVVCFDNDEAGRRGGAKQARALTEAGAITWVANVADKVPYDKADLRDWLTGEGTPEDLHEWMEKVAAETPFSVADVHDEEALERERSRRRVRQTVDAEEASAKAPLGESWRFADLAAAWDREGQIEPTVLSRTDDVRLLYPDALNLVFGEPEAGKGWFALLACKQEMEAGRHVLYVDLEDSQEGVVDRLKGMGCAREAVLAQFHYVHPDEPLTAGQVDEFVALVQSAGVGLAVLDACTEIMSLQGWATKETDDFAKLDRLLLRPLYRTGATVVLIDHIPKSTDGDRTVRYPLGAGHKLAAVKGAAYRVASATPLGRGRRGFSKVYVAKDRPGSVRGALLDGKTAGRLYVDHDPERVPAGQVWVQSADEYSNSGARLAVLGDRERVVFRVCEALNERGDGGEPFTREDVERVLREQFPNECADVGLVVKKDTVNRVLSKLASALNVPIQKVERDGGRAAMYLLSTGESEEVESDAD